MTEERKETLGEFIRRRFHEKALEHPGQFKSLAEFGKWIDPDIKQSTFSTWCNDQKVPTGDNVDILARKLGNEVYKILGVTPRIVHPQVALIDWVWDRLGREERQEWLKRAEEIQRQQEEDAKGRRRSAY